MEEISGTTASIRVRSPLREIPFGTRKGILSTKKGPKFFRNQAKKGCFNISWPTSRHCVLNTTYVLSTPHTQKKKSKMNSPYFRNGKLLNSNSNSVHWSTFTLAPRKSKHVSGLCSRYVCKQLVGEECSCTLPQYSACEVRSPNHRHT